MASLIIFGSELLGLWQGQFDAASGVLSFSRTSESETAPGVRCAFAEGVLIGWPIWMHID